MAVSSPPSSLFIFPPTYSFPPFFTAQPNAQTRSAQLSKWSSFIVSYCRHHRIFKLPLSDALETPLFNNSKLKRRLSAHDAKAVIDYLASKDIYNCAECIGSYIE